MDGSQTTTGSSKPACDGRGEMRAPHGIVQTPPGYFFLLVPRSSTPIKKGLLIPNGIGVIDQDYCGDEDEVKLLVHNFTDAPVTVERGDRIAQAGFVPVERATWNEVEHMPEKSRGGFGSTGER